ncbi:hypothetical protein SAMN04488057_102139 [Cyclobacterium lianum]|uniref:Outer membrane protein beta-barrel domain-containing protein n=1 Tax=Cyclobacterium lianum TaxID=388280 RepID=A0A1M7JRX0_9BACT|nr:hypothetical protein [Cyclobacterium lianum]SHM55830.1 hypothetical protein SAMN04488057_102139 [Cyclobacterium lianum]
MKKQIFILFIGLITSLNIQAQTENPNRKGFTAGASLGVGALHFTDGMSEKTTRGGISLPNLKMGWFVSPRTAIYVNTVGQIYESEGVDRSFEGIIPSIQYWATNKWWVSAGYGASLDMKALYESEADSKKSEWGKGVLISTGYEVLQRQKWALDIQSRFYMARVTRKEDGNLDATNFSLGVGISLF